MGEWWPINTAPEDEPILVYWPGDEFTRSVTTVARISRDSGQTTFSPVGGVWDNHEWAWRDAGPTLWMRLPEAPEPWWDGVPSDPYKEWHWVLQKGGFEPTVRQWIGEKWRWCSVEGPAGEPLTPSQMAEKYIYLKACEPPFKVSD